MPLPWRWLSRGILPRLKPWWTIWKNVFRKIRPSDSIACRRTGFEARVTTLGHVQRGGTPTAFDRVLATRFGVAAVAAVHDGAFGMMVALAAGAIIRIPIAAAVAEAKTVDLDLYRDVAGVFLG